MNIPFKIESLLKEKPKDAFKEIMWHHFMRPYDTTVESPMMSVSLETADVMNRVANDITRYLKMKKEEHA